MTTHTLKIEEIYYNRLVDGTKKAEIRFDDKDFQIGDTIKFKKYWPSSKNRPSEADFDGEYMLLNTEFKITHVLNFPTGLKDGYVCLSLELIKND
jgi:hypothetical protein